VLLAYFTKYSQIKKMVRVADLGCGSGLIPVLLAWHDERLLIDGVEIRSDAIKAALENISLSGFSERISIIKGDIRNHRELLKAGYYDLTVSNPPYFTPGSGKLPASEGSVVARTEVMCSLDDICKAAGYLTRWGGSFSLVHKPERLSYVFRALNSGGFEPKRLRFVQHFASSPPSLVLIESRRGGKPSLAVEAPLILKNDDGSDTEEYKRIYHLP